MATRSFFQSGAGDPTSALRRLASQSADGIPAQGSWIDFYHYGGSQALTPNKLERMAITSGSQLRPSILSKTDLNVVYNLGDLDAASVAQSAFLSRFFLGYNSPVTLDTGAYRHVMGSGQTSGGQKTAKLSIVNSDDTGIPYRFTDVIPSGFTLNLQPRQNMTLNVPCVSGKYDYWGDPTTSGAGVVKPLIRHTCSSNWSTASGAAAEDLYVEIQADTLTTVTFKTKLSSGGSYGAAQTATKGVWTYITAGVSTDAVLGTREEQVQLYFPTGANNDFVDNDVWIFPQRRTVWTPSFGTETVVGEVMARFYFDSNRDGSGEEFVVDNGITITASRETVETRYTTGGVQPVGTFRAGFKRFEIAMNRRFVDLDLQHALMTNTQVAVVIEAITNTQLASTAYEAGYTFIAPNCTLTGSTFTVGDGGSNRDEQITLLARVPSANYTTAVQGTNVTVSSDFAVVWDCAEATLS